MYYLTDFELNTIQKHLSVIKKCREEDKESVSLGILYLKEIIGIYCPYGKLTDQILDEEQLNNFIVNIDRCDISSNNMYFKISYIDGEKQNILKATCLASVMRATEYIGESKDGSNAFAEDLEPTVFHEDVIVSREIPSLIHRKYRIGPLKALAQIEDEKMKRMVMYKNKIELLREDSPLIKGYSELYRYDMYSYAVKENGKIIEKKA